MKICIVTNIPAPYRNPILEIVGEELKDDFLMIFCAKKESNRKWSLNKFNFNHLFLKENVRAKSNGYDYVHNNPDVFKELKKFNPDVIITTGYNPTHLYAWLYSLVFRKKHIPMSDGWIFSENNLSFLHRIIRKIVFLTSSSFIGASKNTFLLFESYGIKRKNIFQSHLCIDNQKFSNNKSFKDRKYHLMFSGQFIERKIPFFFFDITKKLSESIPDLKVLILGSGPLEEELLKKFNNANIDYTYPGFASQEELPKYYSNSKLFLFTTEMDPWGIVANEAMASGTPVIVTPYAGIVNDLLIDSQNGYVIDIDVDKWVDKIKDILSDEEKWQTLSSNAKEKVQEYNFESAAKGIIDASKHAYEN